MDKLTLKDFNKYIKISKRNIIKQNDFLSNIKVKKGNSFFDLEYNFFNENKNNSIYNKYKSELLNNEMIKDGYLPVFVTNTLKSSFHAYKIKNNNKVKKNPKYKGKTIQEGYNVLKDVHRNIYKNFKIKGKNVPVKFLIVYEPHKKKGFTPHSHAIYYIRPEYLNKFKNHIKNKSKNKLGKQQEIVPLDQDSKVIVYILKYITKNLKNNDEKSQDFAHFLDGWKKTNKIRMFNSSKSKNQPPRFLFNKFSKNNQDFFKKYGKEGQNLFKVFNKFVSYKIITKFKNEEKIVEHTATKKDKFFIFVKRNRNQKVKKDILKKELETQKNILNSLNNKKFANNSLIKIHKNTKIKLENINFLDFLTCDLPTKINIDLENKIKKQKIEIENNIKNINKLIQDLDIKTKNKNKTNIYKIIDFKIYKNKKNKNKLIYDKKDFEIIYI